MRNKIYDKKIEMDEEWRVKFKVNNNGVYADVSVSLDCLGISGDLSTFSSSEMDDLFDKAQEFTKINL